MTAAGEWVPSRAYRRPKPKPATRICAWAPCGKVFTPHKPWAPTTHCSNHCAALSRAAAARAKRPPDHVRPSRRPSAVRICAWKDCGKEFRAPRPTSPTVCCSSRCSALYRWDRDKITGKPRPCDYEKCGKTFQPKTPAGRFCNKRCAALAQLEQERDRPVRRTPKALRDRVYALRAEGKTINEIAADPEVKRGPRQVQRILSGSPQKRAPAPPGRRAA